MLDEHELALLCKHAPAHHREVVTVLAYTGLRISEALGLRWRDVDFVERELHVRGQLSRVTKDRPGRIVSTKTAASVRVVPLWPAVEEALTKRLESEVAVGRGDDDDDLVFCTRTGRPLSQSNVRNRGVVKAAKDAGLGHVSPQDLRRSVCSVAGRRGVDPIEAAQITGHSLITWTRHYTESYGKRQRDEARNRMLKHGFGRASTDSEHADKSADKDDPRDVSADVDV